MVAEDSQGGGRLQRRAGMLRPQPVGPPEVLTGLLDPAAAQGERRHVDAQIGVLRFEPQRPLVERPRLGDVTPRSGDAPQPPRGGGLLPQLESRCEGVGRLVEAALVLVEDPPVGQVAASGAGTSPQRRPSAARHRDFCPQDVPFQIPLHQPQPQPVPLLAHLVEENLSRPRIVGDHHVGITVLVQIPTASPRLTAAIRSAPPGSATSSAIDLSS